MTHRGLSQRLFLGPGKQTAVQQEKDTPRAAQALAPRTETLRVAGRCPGFPALFKRGVGAQ